MATAGGVPYKQDLPPKGGYAPINYKRIPAKSVLNAPLIYGGLFASMAYGVYQYKRGMKQVFKEEIEMKSASLAITPLMLAERDREYLKQLRRNRDAEEKLMADVEGWEVGTFYGHKVYKVTHLPIFSTFSYLDSVSRLLATSCPWSALTSSIFTRTGSLEFFFSSFTNPLHSARSEINKAGNAVKWLKMD